jgi:hypothetical protein
MAAINNVKPIKELPSSNGLNKVTDSNFFTVLMQEMKYLSNTLHHTGYLIRIIMTILDEVDVTIKDTTNTYRNVSNALILMNFFYDLVSYLEQEVQCLRNGKAMGTYLLKKVSDSKNKFNKLVFKYDDRLDANIYFLKKSKLKKVTENNKILQEQFYALYEDIEHLFNDCKDQFNNFLKVIKKFELHYEVKYTNNEICILYDVKNKTNQYACKEIDELFKHPSVYLSEYVDHYGTDRPHYDKSKYEFKDRINIKKVDEGISTIKNIITEQNVRSDNTNYITLFSLNMKSKPFVEFLTGLVNSFSLTALDQVSIFYFT